VQTSVLAQNKPRDALAGTGSGRVGADTALSVLGLEKTYRSGFWHRRCRAVAGLSFVVQKGQIFALLGPNGAGKTTTMKAILDLVGINAGQIEIFGIAHRDPRARQRVGYLPESPGFYDHLTAQELLEYYGRLLNLKGAMLKRRIQDVLEIVSMERHRGKKLQKFSKGMLQRIGLAQCLLNDPDLLILDEPMSGLDPLGRRQVRELLLNLKFQGKTVLLSSHIVHDVEVLADSIAVVKDGLLHSVHKPAGKGEGPSFEVSLGAGGKQAAAFMPSSCAIADPDSTIGPSTVIAADVSSLRQLLQVCQENRVRVLSVQTRCSNLEDVYLAVVAGDSAAGRTAPARKAPNACGTSKPVSGLQMTQTSEGERC
jgi:ABC-2 type transport system ATP-binding protein